MNYQIINWDTISESMMGNEEMIKQFVQMYLVQSPVDFEALERAVSNKDMIAIKDKAHHIKPTMQYVGAISLQQDFQLLENMAKEGKDIREIEGLLERIKPKFELLLEELRMLAG